MTRAGESCSECGSFVEYGSCCPGCGVLYGDPCPSCHERGYHEDYCPEMRSYGGASLGYPQFRGR